jgi:hypothetical protein
VSSDEAAEDAAVDPFGISKEYINMGIALMTPIDKLLKLIDESPWRRMLDAASKHMTGQENSAVIVQIDTNSGELITKVETNEIRLNAEANKVYLRVDRGIGASRGDGVVAADADSTPIAAQPADISGRRIAPHSAVIEGHHGGGVEQVEHPT